jgi:hypothetical protein
MPTPTVEERLAALEQQVEELKAKQNGSQLEGNWRSTVGWAKDDPGYDEMASLGAEYRNSLNDDQEDAGS